MRIGAPGQPVVKSPGSRKQRPVIRVLGLVREGGRFFEESRDIAQASDGRITDNRREIIEMKTAFKMIRPDAETGNRNQDRTEEPEEEFLF
jgi:hypothetical protein